MSSPIYFYSGSKAVKRETVRSVNSVQPGQPQVCLQPSTCTVNSRVDYFDCLQWFAIHLQFQNFAYMSEWYQLRTSAGICIMLLSHIQHDILVLLSTIGGKASFHCTRLTLQCTLDNSNDNCLSFACRSRHMYLKGTNFFLLYTTVAVAYNPQSIEKNGQQCCIQYLLSWSGSWNHRIQTLFFPVSSGWMSAQDVI